MAQSYGKNLTSVGQRQTHDDVMEEIYVIWTTITHERTI